MDYSITISTLQDKILSHIVKDDNGCWNWTAALRNGYAQFTAPALARKTFGTRYVHRIVYMLTRGVKLNGKDMTMVIDHICRNKKCINPNHLQYISSGDNLRRTPSHDLSHVGYHNAAIHELRTSDIFYYRNKNRPSAYKRCRVCFNKYMREHKDIRT